MSKHIYLEVVVPVISMSNPALITVHGGDSKKIHMSAQSVTNW